VPVGSRRAAALEKEGRFVEAAEEYRRRLAEEPSAPNHLGAGYNLARAGYFDEGLPLLREGVRLDPASPDGHFRLAHALFLAGEAARRKAPDAPRARELFREAAEEAGRAAGLKPDHSAAYLRQGRALLALGEPAAAVEPLRKGVNCRPEEVELQLYLGEALLAAGPLGEAEAPLENGPQLAPSAPRPGAAPAPP